MTTYIVKGVTFVAIPKNASTSIGCWLHDNFLRQITYPKVGGIHASLPMIENATPITCAVVRNPWSRVVSAWAYEKKNPLKRFHQRGPLKPELPSFDDFVRNLNKYSLIERAWFTWATPQKEWIPNGVTYLLRFETLEEDFKKIQNLFGCSAPLKLVNTSDHEDYRTYYTPETQAIVADIFKDDIELFGYEF
jgi:Sulfotransferase family